MQSLDRTDVLNYCMDREREEVRRLRRAWMLWLMILMFAASGLAEDDADRYWTGKGDVYYHLDADCGHTGRTRVSLSREAAEMFDRLPCPICLSAPAEAPETPVSDEIQVAERGGTWVFRMPGKMLEALSTTQSDLPDGTQTLLNLYGGTLTDVLDTWAALPADGALLMNLRAMGGDTYVVVRPAKRYKDSRPFRWQAAHLLTDIFNPGAFSLEGVSPVMEYAPEDVVKRADMKKLFSEKYDDLEIDVYRAMDSLIAVLHIKGLNGENELTGTLRIGDLRSAIPIAGYATKKEAVFCCVLSEEELEALKAGSAPVYAPGLETAAPRLTQGVPDLSDDVVVGESLPLS